MEFKHYLLDTIPLDELIRPSCRNELTTNLVALQGAAK